MCRAGCGALENGQRKRVEFEHAKTAQLTKLTQLTSTLGTIANASFKQACGEEVDWRYAYECRSLTVDTDSIKIYKSGGILI